MVRFRPLTSSFLVYIFSNLNIGSALIECISTTRLTEMGISFRFSLSATRAAQQQKPR